MFHNRNVRTLYRESGKWSKNGSATFGDIRQHTVYVSSWSMFDRRFQ